MFHKKRKYESISILNSRDRALVSCDEIKGRMKSPEANCNVNNADMNDSLNHDAIKYFKCRCFYKIIQTFLYVLRNVLLHMLRSIDSHAANIT